MDRHIMHSSFSFLHCYGLLLIFFSLFACIESYECMKEEMHKRMWTWLSLAGHCAHLIGCILEWENAIQANRSIVQSSNVHKRTQTEQQPAEKKQEKKMICSFAVPRLPSIAIFSFATSVLCSVLEFWPQHAILFGPYASLGSHVVALIREKSNRNDDDDGGGRSSTSNSN